MALRNPPSYQSNAQLPAANDRLFLKSLVRNEGVVSATDLVVTAGSGFTISISLGALFMINDLDTNGGYYWCFNDAATTVNLTGSNGTFPRIDRVCIRVRDTEYSGTINDVGFVVVTGTATSTPQVPAFPTDGTYYELAQLLVPAGVTLATQLTITDKRGIALFHSDAIPVASSASLPSIAGNDGLMALTLNDGRVWVYANGSWSALLKVNDSTLTLSGALTAGTLAAGGGAFVVDGTGNVQAATATTSTLATGTLTATDFTASGSASIKSLLHRPRAAYMTDSGTTTSTSYTNTLTGSVQANPAFTFTAPPSGVIKVTICGRLACNGGFAFLGVRSVSSAHGTTASSDDRAAITSATAVSTVSSTFLLSGYTSGETITLNAQYKVTAGTGTFDSIGLIAEATF